MVNLDLGHQPSLTNERVIEIISKHFGYKTGMKQGRFHIVEKSAMIVAILKLDQLGDRTKLRITGTFPKSWIDIACIFACVFTGVGCIAWIVYSILHSGFEKELATFVKNNSDFYPDNKPQ